MKQKLGRIETQFFAYVQMRQIRTVRTGDLAASVQHRRRIRAETVERLARGGLIARVRQGLYLVPLRLPLWGRTPTRRKY
jgi:hypothetical protein